jgi:hypothetical protein
MISALPPSSREKEFESEKESYAETKIVPDDL